MKSLVFRAYLQLLRFELLLHLRDFASVYRTVRLCPVKARPVPADVQEVCQAVDIAAIWYPKEVLCLHRAAATTCLLRNSGARAHLVIGVQPVPFRAHAWVEVSGHVVNDKAYIPDVFTVLDRC